MVSISEHKKYVLFLNLSFLLVACVFLIMQFNSAEFLVLRSSRPSEENDLQNCQGLHSLDDYEAKCLYIKSSIPCVSQGYIDYLYLFYCNLGRFAPLGYYLSKLLNLSPTIAGVTLLSLGNGAPDVFSSLVSFMGDGTSGVGFNTIIGGASFVSCVVVGIISILAKQEGFRVNRCAFFRDVCFFLLVLVSLFFIMIHGTINLWGAIGFLSMYIVYFMIVYTLQVHWNGGGKESERNADSSYGSDLDIPILSSMEKGEQNHVKECGLEWSKPAAVTSVTMAPVLISALWNSQDESATLSTTLIVYGIGLMLGMTFGVSCTCNN
ncbi:hypothetical protein OIU84_017672 [Salix udensis]|uniref:Sodium/calcium exchanger membrane region domain-containing protein n=1 Tax=Salix udensis TaxID=889485 RepID=A0AAD6L2C7_9ROSI|nr:hypothetical protein OIU84_017672 [Salix udensis]